MKHISKEAISKMEKIERLNLINSCTGYKSANLLATKSLDGNTNVAIFSSITHLGSNPAIIGFIMRPTTVPRDTYKNIKETGYFTVNHITADMIADAHHTSANYDLGVSEFDKTSLEEEYKTNIETPFVKGSPVQLHCKYLNEYYIQENNTIHVIAAIENLFFEEKLIHKDGWLQIDKGNVVALNGLDGYCLPKLIDRFEYARKEVSTVSFYKK
ncbi:flavin oxidoreductase [Flavobacterium sp. GSP27]|uniref:flavin reductase family protein n=1 Tax=unclassified Flavobacterium TaxID=196869 RepID=UPI000F82B4F8|nr:MULTISPECIES: flavin reductase [unclassified Flavobacterium]RTY93496.1 flavin oxidoreductase [Flavobacterium sp. GSN2]RTY64105.1 flavin oxidoreductase [Flavobacterium sp. LB2P53]RTY80894.1 flavin oxidoreductase [Flavobacterium sp. LS1P28]RTY82848.1 flavin oxidoreductase [Flavobacterium sp. ZB4P23]RTY86429.1 flavin oxidoreductase [Flavobacterium sp. RSP15]